MIETDILDKVNRMIERYSSPDAGIYFLARKREIIQERKARAWWASFSNAWFWVGLIHWLRHNYARE